MNVAELQRIFKLLQEEVRLQDKFQEENTEVCRMV
jgi:hypothetical protein